MTEEDIIRLAIENTIHGLRFDEQGLLRFAKLIAQHEREACLKFCDEVAEYFPSSGFVGSYIGQKIRARGQA